MIESRKLPTIDASRIKLRHLEESDIDDLFDIFSDQEAMLYWSSPPFAERSEAAKLLLEIHKNLEKKQLFQWGIALRETDKIIGTSTLFHLDMRNRRAEIGYALNRNYWKQGFVNEALKALFKFAFDELNLHRIEADVDPNNAASIRVLEKLGFQKEGFLRERWFVGGKTFDSFFYGLLRSEWQEITK